MSEKYQIIYADPPWKFNNKNTGGSLKSGADAHYPTMTLDSICTLDIKKIADENCALFMWWVGSMPIEALTVVDAWGFTLKTMTGFTWVKLTKNQKLAFGMGFWTRQGSENCLIAVRGNIKRIDAGIRNVIIEEDTGFYINEAHSKKPPIFRERITELMGDIPRVELFARERFEGWHAWGNEVNSDIKI